MNEEEETHVEKPKHKQNKLKKTIYRSRWLRVQLQAPNDLKRLTLKMSNISGLPLNIYEERIK